jgi:hypothetical protein
MKPAQESPKDIACRQSGWFESEKEHDSKRKPGSDKEKAPECGKAIARAGPGNGRRGLVSHQKAGVNHGWLGVET